MSESYLAWSMDAAAAPCAAQRRRREESSSPFSGVQAEEPFQFDNMTFRAAEAVQASLPQLAQQRGGSNDSATGTKSKRRRVGESSSSPWSSNPWSTDEEGTTTDGLDTFFDAPDSTPPDNTTASPPNIRRRRRRREEDEDDELHNDDDDQDRPMTYRGLAGGAAGDHRQGFRFGTNRN